MTVENTTNLPPETITSLDDGSFRKYSTLPADAFAYGDNQFARVVEVEGERRVEIISRTVSETHTVATGPIDENPDITMPGLTTHFGVSDTNTPQIDMSINVSVKGPLNTGTIKHIGLLKGVLSSNGSLPINHTDVTAGSTPQRAINGSTPPAQQKRATAPKPTDSSYAPPAGTTATAHAAERTQTNANYKPSLVMRSKEFALEKGVQLGIIVGTVALTAMIYHGPLQNGNNLGESAYKVCSKYSLADIFNTTNGLVPAVTCYAGEYANDYNPINAIKYDWGIK